MRAYAKNFIQKNLYQIIVGLILAISNLITFYTSFQLFQQSTNFRVAAIQNDIVDIKQSIKDITNISAKVEVIDTKLDAATDRIDRQADAIKDLRTAILQR